MKNAVPLKRNRMRTYLLLVALIVFSIDNGDGTCTFPFTGTWHSSNYGSMVFSGLGLYLSGFTFDRTSIVGSGWECFSNTGTTYVAKTNMTITLNNGGAAHYAYTCFVFTSVNTYSYYYRQNTPVESLLKNERIVAYTTGATVTSGDVCSSTPSDAEFNVMVQSGQEANAKTNIGEVMFANFHYKYNNGVSDKCGTGTTESMLTICTDRQTLTFDYTVCSDNMMYSSGGVLGAVATIESGSTYYTSVYNYDNTVDGVNTFRFTCIAAATSGTQVSATINPKSCIANQSPTSRPTSGGIFTLVANTTCALTATVDNVDVAGIIGGIVGGVLFIVIVLIVILLCIRHHKIKRAKQEVIDRRMRVWKIRSNEDDFYADDVPLNETSMNLDCTKSIYPEASSSRTTKVLQKKQKDGDLEDEIRNPIGEKSFQVETHRNKEKITKGLPFSRPRTEHMPWRTGKRAEKKGYSSERGYPSMSKFGSVSTRSYTTLKTMPGDSSSGFGSMYDKDSIYTRSGTNLSRGLTVAGSQFKSDSNIYAKAKSLTERSMARELTAIKETPLKETPNYMKPTRSRTAMSIYKERAKSQHSTFHNDETKSRVSKSRVSRMCDNESQISRRKDTQSRITKVSPKTLSPKERVMARAKSKMIIKEKTKTWRITEKHMPNPKPVDEKSFVDSLRDNPPSITKKKKKPKKVIVKKLKTPYGVVLIDSSQKRTVSMMSLNQLAGLVKKRKTPSRSQVDIVYKEKARETTVVKDSIKGNDVKSETSSQKGGREFMESEHTWMVYEQKTGQPPEVEPTTNTDRKTDKVDTKSNRVGSDDSGFSDNNTPPVDAHHQSSHGEPVDPKHESEELELINILPPTRPPKFFKNIADRAKTAKSRKPSWK
ncbi:uncharacterized protein LOC133196866 [Saccostrea echinata]|uniref:uncharacterized protein LOC133196866 n=1 Tax=Saccostrea echinata TaxID=191078 RepID=UPI002A7F32BA|nr:uncharacterized protein LOC133196866 [Saccostrea echinata]